MSSSTGTIFRITTFGESHGPGIGVVIDGCPAGLILDLDSIKLQLKRRRPGQSHITTQRKEMDDFEILSGVYKEKTLGTPLTFLIRNLDVKKDDYLRWQDVYRPSHADYTYDAKYGYRTEAGGGRASARETIGRVIAGTVAGQILETELDLRTVAWVDSIGSIDSDIFNTNPPANRDEVDSSLVRCPHKDISMQMINLIEKTAKDGDSVGGIIGVIVRNVPPGLGSPVFAKLEAELAKACLSIPACKGFESGSGFGGSARHGSDHNDEFIPIQINDPALKKTGEDAGAPPEIKTRTNFSGGIQGGISNGMPILMRLAFKPTATINKEQNTVDTSGHAVKLKAGGRHDPCVLPRAVPIVEAMVNLVLIDEYFKQRAVRPQWSMRYGR